MSPRFWIGKIIGGAAGFLLLDIPGIFLGGFVGHLFDRAMAGNPGIKVPLSAAKQRANDAALPELLFTLMGCLAKADGRVSEEEVHYTESLMAHFQLSPKQRQEAIAAFREGTQPGFQLEFFAAHRLRQLRGTKSSHTLLTLLISLALVDHRLEPKEMTILRQIAAHLQYSPARFTQLLRMVKAQQHFSGATASDAPGDEALRHAYEALGLTAPASEAEVKRAYRKLMGTYHPDKLAARQLPEEIQALAKQKTQEIQNAYDTIRKSRT